MHCTTQLETQLDTNAQLQGRLRGAWEFRRALAALPKLPFLNFRTTRRPSNSCNHDGDEQLQSRRHCADMSTILQSRSAALALSSRGWTRCSTIRYMATETTQAQPEASSSSQPSATHGNAPNTHFKVTLKRSGISLGDKIKGTLLALGFHRRFQTVYHRHTPEAAGMILKVKELVEVENVPEHMVRTPQEQRRERKATRGYKVVGNRRDSLMNL